MPALPLRRILYGSSAPALLSADDVSSILRASRRNNAADGVTGALLYADGNFIQVLEGAPEAVARTYERIRRDPRHRQIATYLDQPAGDRMFPDWSMGLLRMDDLSSEDRASVRSLSDADASASGAVRHLLQSFRDMASGMPRAIRV